MSATTGAANSSARTRLSGDVDGSVDHLVTGRRDLHSRAVTDVVGRLGYVGDDVCGLFRGDGHEGEAAVSPPAVGTEWTPVTPVNDRTSPRTSSSVAVGVDPGVRTRTMSGRAVGKYFVIWASARTDCGGIYGGDPTGQQPRLGGRQQDEADGREHDGSGNRDEVTATDGGGLHQHRSIVGDGTRSALVRMDRTGAARRRQLRRGEL